MECATAGRAVRRGRRPRERPVVQLPRLRGPSRRARPRQPHNLASPGPGHRPHHADRRGPARARL